MPHTHTQTQFVSASVLRVSVCVYTFWVEDSKSEREAQKSCRNFVVASATNEVFTIPSPGSWFQMCVCTHDEMDTERVESTNRD